MEYRVIKEGDLFLLTDLSGDIAPGNEQGHGLYSQDTRFLSRMELRIDGEKPAVLSSAGDKSYVANFRLMKDVKDEGAIEVKRDCFIYDGILYVRIAITNYFVHDSRFGLSVAFGADFQDMFLVRKYRGGEVGFMEEPVIGDGEIMLGYVGADRERRQARITWDAQGGAVHRDGTVSFPLSLKPKEEREITFFIAPVSKRHPEGKLLGFEEGLRKLEQSYERWYEDNARVESDFPVFNGLYQRGLQDLRMLTADIGFGETTVAGLPWFAVPFGRDSLITSLFMLPANPRHASGTLRTLAAYQGEKSDPWRDEQPGKIMHEIRFGELVTTKQSPFSPYYGTIDSTPLFLVLIGEYYRWTGDLSLVKELRPNILRALEYIDASLQAGSGFMAYKQEAEKGFPNQGWKDSANSVIHENGTYAASPIALAEVQGYVYQAKRSLAPLFELMGEPEAARRLAEEAEALKERFESAFWMDDEQSYAIALDKELRQVRSVTSNPGHLFMSGLPDGSRAKAQAERLLRRDMYNGYGIRTMSTDAAGYYPMSYHNGSVWPHDNAMILLGLGKMGFKAQAQQVIEGLLKASRYFEYQRFPELFCGHDSELGYPVPYPTTCSPQAWAAGTSLAFLQVMLGLYPDALRKEIRLSPFLPDGMNTLRVRRISIGNGHLSVNVSRNEDGVTFRTEIAENTTGFAVAGL
ncbi:MAG: glycogen debranching N-terminal domain-containing protein [Paenibacillus macerans]|uniref:Amylo-alpha-1,6-glucosidase n=1 Tax=Paenibacillus macerans TaxID=44252 RepID=A0A090ZDD7_PAEMA|nr:glycogen debranching N-terminal domain-containing protein [Paenibacillus macerans]KFN08617.1 amylo-alpha-1,6-glucosidase family protein [Paenibacillus macerans]MBS5913048.1 amylo-alpha-1,6-glucosidase [Paenibacillus macerans]MCY7560581.1 amylo-alpha-1,6-glucosidase [Paenibacillus macerans]MDU5946318.1 glycogen debranching N-terminal domain-containing protein [Paenibacillus macerans]MDU7475224.1 glycogen debranching N-terminal domain-containing protein [Paenibacillus macerans]